MTKDEMVGWHHQLNGHEFEQAPGDGEGQDSLTCCSPWGCKESDTTEQPNNNKNMGLKERSSVTLGAQDKLVQETVHETKQGSQSHGALSLEDLKGINPHIALMNEQLPIEINIMEGRNRLVCEQRTIKPDF